MFENVPEIQDIICPFSFISCSPLPYWWNELLIQLLIICFHDIDQLICSLNINISRQQAASSKSVWLMAIHSFISCMSTADMRYFAYTADMPVYISFGFCVNLIIGITQKEAKGSLVWRKTCICLTHLAQTDWEYPRWSKWCTHCTVLSLKWLY